VGKKPPQSQMGGSHGLTPRMSMGLSPKKQKKKKKEKNNFIFIFIIFLLVAGDLVELCGAACAQHDSQFLFFLLYIFLFLFLFNPWGLAPRTSAGLSHGSPLFDFEVTFCPPPTS
jgi:hypothetical protein